MIHPTAIIHENAIIADNVEIGAYSVIGENVEIGEGTKVGPHVVIKGPTKIGKDNILLQFSSIGEDPQDLKYHGEPTRLEIGDRNTVREFCTLNRGTPTGGDLTKIGSDNLIMAYCHIAHDCMIGDHTILANNTTLAGHVVVEDKVKLGGFTVVHQFCRLGYGCFTGGESYITQDVPPYTLVGSESANAVGINKVGMKRAGIDDEVIRAVNKSYRKLVFSRGTNRDEAIAELQPLIDQFKEVKQFVDFIINSERGIVRTRR